MGKADYDRVVAEMRLADGTLWPLPVTLPVTPGDGVAEGKPLALRDVYGNLLAFLHVEEIYLADKERGSRAAPTARSTRPHPSVAYLNRQPGHYASGRLEVIRVPPHYDFVELRRTPAELRQHFQSPGLEPDRRLPDPQSAAPGPRRADQAGRRADRRRPVDSPGRRRHQAGRRGPLHPGPLLSRPGRQLLRAGHRGAQPAAPGHAHGRPARGACCTRSSAATTAAPTSSSAATTPGRATTRPASRSTLPTPPRSRWASTRTRSAWRWSTSSRWSSCPTRTATARSTKSRPAPRRPTSPAPRSATSTWPRASSFPSGSAGRPWPRS